MSLQISGKLLIFEPLKHNVQNTFLKNQPKTLTMAKDTIHDPVIRALEKDGWDVSTPLYIAVPGTRVEIDAAAEKFILAEKSNVQIAVEIKTFAHDSIVQATSDALGKFNLYQKALKQSEEYRGRKLYIATSIQGYYRLQNVEFIREAIKEDNVPFIIVDINKEIIKKWIE